MPRTNIGPVMGERLRSAGSFDYTYMQLDPTTGEVLLFGERSAGDGLSILCADDMAVQLRLDAQSLSIAKPWGDASSPIDSHAGDDDPDGVDDFIRRYQRAYDV